MSRLRFPAAKPGPQGSVSPRRVPPAAGADGYRPLKSASEVSGAEQAGEVVIEGPGWSSTCRW